MEVTERFVRYLLLYDVQVIIIHITTGVIRKKQCRRIEGEGWNEELSEMTGSKKKIHTTTFSSSRFSFSPRRPPNPSLIFLSVVVLKDSHEGAVIFFPIY